MRHALQHLDAVHLPLGDERFLIRAIALGQQSGTLPDQFAATLLGYLRLEGMAHARAARTGLRLERETLEQGVRQVLVCVELAVEKQSEGRLDQAAQVLAASELTALRRQGWELAWKRLDEMRRQCELRCRRRATRLLREYLPDLRRWATLSPEAWTAVDPDGKAVLVDPQLEYLSFRQVMSRAAVVDSLPSAPVRDLLAVLPEGATFAGLLRRLVVAVALDQESLQITAAQIRRFQRRCLADGLLRPEVRMRTVAQIAGHLDRVLSEVGLRTLIQAEVDEAIEVLEQGALGDLGQWCLIPDGLDQETELLALLIPPGLTRDLPRRAGRH